METPGCPNCSNREATAVSFTWWGGLLGPRLLNHVRCDQCGTEYNGRTGRSNTTGIVIYAVVAGVLALAITFAVIMAR
jgi:hypothetical protein